MVIDIAKFRTMGPSLLGTVYSVLLLTHIRGLRFKHAPITLRELAQFYDNQVRIEQPTDLPPNTDLRIVTAELLQEGGAGSRTQPSVVGVFVPHGASVPQVIGYLQKAFGSDSSLLDSDGAEIVCEEPLTRPIAA